jgi:hypothetical protein
MKKLITKLKELLCLHNYQNNKYLIMMNIPGKQCIKCKKFININN